MKNIQYIIYALCLLFITSCGNSEKEWEVSEGSIFGTTYGIQYEAKENYKESFDSAFLAINQSMSTYDENSLISKLNRGESIEKLDTMFIEVFSRAKKYNEQTKGYFDPTIGDVVNAWGFGAKKKVENIDSAKIDSLMQFVGLHTIEIKNKQLFKKYTNTYLEFNAFAKGYALDIISRILDKKEVENYLIEIGGEIRCKGLNAKKVKWIVGVDKPVENLQKTELSARVALSNQSMATSGNYRKFYEDSKGNKYVHTIDPHTGYPVRSNLLSSVVIAKDCITADAYATALMAMGLERGKAFFKENPTLEGMLLFSDEKGNIKEWRTDDFPIIE